jgi:hypothetical protein
MRLRCRAASAPRVEEENLFNISGEEFFFLSSSITTHFTRLECFFAFCFLPTRRRPEQLRCFWALPTAESKILFIS